MTNKAYEMWDAMKDKSYQKIIDDINDVVDTYINNPEELIKYCLEKIGTVLHSKSSSFWLYHSTSDGLITPFVYYGDIDFSDYAFFPNESLIGKVVERNEAIILDKSHDNKEYFDNVRVNFDSLMCLPIELNGMAFGCILFVDKTDGYYYDNRDLELANTLAHKLVEILSKTGFLSTYDKVRNINGKKFNAAVLAVDIVNYSSLYLDLDVDTLVGILHTFSLFVCNCINDNYGTFVKLVNDKFVAYFSDNVEDPCYHAIKAAKELLEKRITLQQKIKKQYNIDIIFKVAIDYGEIFVGRIGNSANLANEVVGNTYSNVMKISDIVDNNSIAITKNVYDQLIENYELNVQETENVKLGNKEIEVFKLK